MKAAEIEDDLRSCLHWYAEHVDDLFARVKAGDPDAVGELLVTLPNGDRGLGVRWVLALDLDLECLRTAMSAAWRCDHEVLAAEAGRRSTLVRWFRRAAFETHTLPWWFHVWRGSAGLTVAKAKRGLSWTRDRDVACWFATQFRRDGRQGEPLVLKRRVERWQVLYHGNERQEHEVVVALPPKTVTVDGDPADWVERGAIREALNRAEMRRLLDRHKAA